MLGFEVHVVAINSQDLFQALSDYTRVRIIRLLAVIEREACSCEMSESLNEPEYKISKHLKILRQSGLLSAEKEGRWIYHKIVKQPPYLNLLIDLVKSLPDNDNIFAMDQKRFNNFFPLRKNGRCKTKSNNTQKELKNQECQV